MNKKKKCMDDDGSDKSMYGRIHTLEERWTKSCRHRGRETLEVPIVETSTAEKIESESETAPGQTRGEGVVHK